MTDKNQTRLVLDMPFEQAIKRFANVQTKELTEPPAEKGKATPFLKWVGGKRSIIGELTSRLPKDFKAYWEPFVGGGALFFEMGKDISDAHLSDLNIELVITYNVVKKHPEQLIKALRKHAEKHSKEYYYKIRAKHEQTDAVARAARLIYLNRTCFNGLYRTNKKGEFNVPMGRYKNPDIIRENVIRSCSKALQHATVTLGDFTSIQPKKGDFVYFDPPYHPINGTSFTSYTGDDFNEKDQERLRDFLLTLHKKGVKVMLSNSNTPFILNLYKNKVFKVHEVSAPRNVNCKADKRSHAKEVLITNYATDGTKNRRDSSQ